jgi:transcriptional regulator of acetoin/glycerol metabolism
MDADVLVGALDAVDQGILVCDRAGAVLHANRAARTLLGGAVPDTRVEVMRRIAGGATERPVNGGSVLVLRPREEILPLAERERQAIEAALRDSNWQLAQAARRLGISRTTLWRRLKGYGLSRPAEASRRAIS